MTYTIGSLFSGSGGLDMGVQMALGPADLRWVSDVEPGPCSLLAHHWPTVPLNTLVTLLPTPRASDGEKGGPNQHGSRGDLTMPSACQPQRFDAYAPAIERWERLLRPAPDPTEPNDRGGRRLSARFVEWMQGMPDGHVTDIGLTRVQQLRILGNGVVPQQAAHALRLLSTVSRAGDVAA